MKITILTALEAVLASRGFAQQFVMYTPGGDDTSVERIDPILSPGHIGQHVHQVFGSNALDPLVSYRSLQNATCTTVGDASGRGNAADNSIYWHPALYMEAKDGSGYIKLPTNGHKLYYQNAGSPNDKKREPFEFPRGFRMIAGNPFMRAPAKNIQRQNITQWICHSNDPPNQGTAGGFPNGVTNCNAYPGFNGALHFPHCWNGESFNLSDPTAHMSYPVGDVSQGYCPPSHPIRLPHIFVENQFDVNAVVDLVKPDTFVLAQGDNTGYGWHADFFNGWDAGAIPELLNTCPQGQWGNEDIGTCASFKPSNFSTSACMLPKFYKERVYHPGQFLPGCNPVDDSNPAPVYVTAPLGTYSDQCQIVGQAPPAASDPTTSTKSPDPRTTQHSTATTLTTVHTKPTENPTKPVSSDISCPSSDGHLYRTKNGKTFLIQCNTDHVGGDLKSLDVNNLEECMEACAGTTGCIDVSLSGVACYMKSQLGQRLSDSSVNGAKLVTTGIKRAAREH